MSKVVDSIIGHAIGDAMGVPTEFYPRHTLLNNPVLHMIGSEKTGQPKGSWSDDTSMEIGTIDSVVRKGYFDYDDIMHNWTKWINDNEFTPNNDTFDVGRSCLKAIKRYTDKIKPIGCGSDSINSNGNGSLMRILPVALYSYYKDLSKEEVLKLTNEVSSLTHAHDISKMACYMYVNFIINLLKGLTKEQAYTYMQQDDYSSYSKEAIDTYSRILKNNIKELDIDSINSSGYVVDTWECALWVLLNSKSYKEAIIATTNIGQDTDTIGAITGSMAGIIYGIDQIPKDWLNDLMRRDYLIDLANKFEEVIINNKKDILLGTIIGDIVGSRFEHNNNKNGKEFELFNKDCKYTDDTVMTLAIAKALLNSKEDYSDIDKQSIKYMTEIGNKYSKCGYGSRFKEWLKSKEHKPYESFGNGSAMRISPVSLVTNDIDKIKTITDSITNTTHNHIDSIKGSEAIAIAINMALNNKTKEEIKEYIESNYFKIDEIESNHFHINCIETVKQSLNAFFNSKDYEDAIRIAISYGGDSDTLGAITGSIASAYYGIPEVLCNTALRYLDDYLLNIYNEYTSKYNKLITYDNINTITIHSEGWEPNFNSNVFSKDTCNKKIFNKLIQILKDYKYLSYKNINDEHIIDGGYYSIRVKDNNDNEYFISGNINTFPYKLYFILAEYNKYSKIISSFPHKKI